MSTPRIWVALDDSQKNAMVENFVRRAFPILKEKEYYLLGEDGEEEIYDFDEDFLRQRVASALAGLTRNCSHIDVDGAFYARWNRLPKRNATFEYILEICE